MKVNFSILKSLEGLEFVTSGLAYKIIQNYVPTAWETSNKKTTGWSSATKRKISFFTGKCRKGTG